MSERLGIYFWYRKLSKAAFVLVYSQVPIKRVGHNKRVGWIVLKKMLNVQGESVPNKRVG